MPLGSTHDRITLWTLPGITLTAGLMTQSSAVALAVGSAYLFSGLMFSGDLDIRSRQYKRWLWLRWIWLPYRQTFRHRSLWSHGPFIGTVIRVFYLMGWLLALALMIGSVGVWAEFWPWQPEIWSRWITTTLRTHARVLMCVGIGLELGSLTHSFSDWTLSAWRRQHRRKHPSPKRHSSRSQSRRRLKS